MVAPALIADPARDADVQALFEIGVALFFGAGEAMRYTAADAVFLDDGDEILVGIALMQEHGLADTCGDFELPMKRKALRVARRKIPEVVEPAFADGHDDLGTCRGCESLERGIREIRGMMGMHARGCVEPPLMRPGQRHRLARRGHARTR